MLPKRLPIMITSGFHVRRLLPARRELIIGSSMTTYRFLIIIEKAEHNYSAYVPDLPGCVTTGKTIDEIKQNMQEAIDFHLRGMIEDQEPIPMPLTTAAYVDVRFPGLGI
jgi:predicted RNase H-like HicB family nuclease